MSEQTSKKPAFTLGFVPKEGQASRSLAHWDVMMSTPTQHTKLTAQAARILGEQLIKRADQIERASSSSKGLKGHN